MKFTSRPKRAGAALLCLALLTGLLPAGALAAGTEISYIDAEGEKQTRTDATEVAESDTSWGDDNNDGWYVVNGDIEIGQRVTVTGDVHLILADECNLTVNGGINVSGTNSLTIYGQAEGTGTLITNGGSNQAGIGGGSFGAGGTITINGGAVTANGGSSGAGIGGGSFGAGGTITINGG